ncbi:hypothetical protein TWF594_004487 [Orbilia oligospora]|nr:hypothetical protein TWF594_004487 [Orbilia oligospora]KAF3158814.1 hypothetical protein TWF751_001267 [Orbilia oligospora]
MLFAPGAGPQTNPMKEMRSSYLFPPTSSPKHCETIQMVTLIVQVYRRLSPASDIPIARGESKEGGNFTEFGVEPVNPPASKMAKDGRTFNDISSSRCSSPLHRPCRGPGCACECIPCQVPKPYLEY